MNHATENMSIQLRLEVADAFRQARKLIASNGRVHICHALRFDLPWHPGSAAAAAIVRQRMGPNPSGGRFEYSLVDWLRDNDIQTPPLGHGLWDAMRVYRLRWLNSLIKEFSR